MSNRNDKRDRGYFTNSEKSIKTINPLILLISFESWFTEKTFRIEHHKTDQFNYYTKHLHLKTVLNFRNELISELGESPTQNIPERELIAIG
jgi:hypothetical protein